MSKLQYGVSPAGVVLRCKLKNSTVTTGAGLTGLTYNSAGLIISTIQDGEATPTVYTQAGSTIEDIATLGTYAAPTATKCRFKEIDATNHPGLYEIQLANARFESMNSLTLSISGAINLMEFDSEIQIDASIWDEILTGSTHNIPTSAGRRVREIAGVAISSDVAQGGTSTTITLAASIPGADGVYNRNLIVIIEGTGKGQTRTIVDYDSATKICVIDREWRVVPDATSEYQILADDTPLVSDHGVAQGGTATTITLRPYAASINDIYKWNIVIIVAGTGRGQARLAGAYNGTTKVVTICGDNWITTPDATSIYVMIPYGVSCACCICDDALIQINDQIVDVLKTDTVAEMSQGVPPLAPTIEQILNYLYRKLRNKGEITATTDTVYANDDSTELFKETHSDDGTTFTKGKYVSGT